MREREIFIEALEKDNPSDRAALLDVACQADAELRERVERLLAEHDRQESFILDTPPASLDTTLEHPITERPGTVIGPYKLLQQIGEGGMGVVFMAEQTEPIQRTVALKIIKPGMDTRQVIARFEAERQALAMMDHPNIARVIDAGTTGEVGGQTSEVSGQNSALAPTPDLRPLTSSSGRPYFVMDLVKGVPITDYCDAQHLSVRQRLELMTQVCHAVQHAHQKGIIHRDLKPSNVLVAEYDGKPVPKIIDFGVAKATAQRLTERTMFTQYGQIVGTFEYMSPEQARFNQLDVDTRSDIYSLGVLLYELLAGSTPFGRKRLNEAAFDEMLRIIREEEPPKPSTRLSSSDALPSIAANRGLEPLKLNRLVQGELDWIVMKALEKDRNRRYETANDLVGDLERYLHDEPVRACPPSAIYRFRKFARRNRIALAFSAAIVAALVLGTCISTWQAFVAIQAREEATVAQVAAEANFQKALAAVDQMLTEVSEESLVNVPQMEPVRRALLEKALAFYQGFFQERSTDPRIRLESGRAYLRVSHIYYMMGQHLQAEEACRQATSVFEELESQFPDVPAYREQTAHSYYRLGFLLVSMQADNDQFVEESERAVRQALVRFEKLATEFPDERHYRYKFANCYGGLGRILKSHERYEDAEIALRKAIELHRRASVHYTATPEDRSAFGSAYHGLAVVLQNVGRHDEAERYFRTALEQRRKLAADFPDVAMYRRLLALGHYDFGKLLDSNERPQEAEQAFREALMLQESIVEDFPNVWDYRWELADTLDDLGQMLHRGGRSDEAKSHFARAAEVYRPTVEYRETQARAFLQEQRHRVWLAASYRRLSDLLHAAGRVEDATDAFRRFLETREKLAADFPENIAYRAGLPDAYEAFGDLLQAAGRTQEAADAFQQPDATRKQLAADFPDAALHHAAVESASQHPSHRNKLFRAEAAELLGITETESSVERQPKNDDESNTNVHH